MKKYQNKYRIPSARLRNWDYGWNAAYYITICTHNRKHFFGEIANGKMNFSEIGVMAEKYWYEIPQHFPFVKLGAFVVMPNHIHGIIIIDKSNGDGIGDGIGDGHIAVETQDFASLRQNFASISHAPAHASQSKNKFGPQSKNLASIVRGYKIGVTKNAKKIEPLWQWQSRYHDHIIRNAPEYNRIKNYIIKNPQNWKDDNFHE